MSSNLFTRRAIARAITSLPIAAAVGAGCTETMIAAPETPQTATAEAGPLKKAQDNVRQTADKLRAIDVPMSVEPAFIFKA